MHLYKLRLFWIAVIVLALILSHMLRETGSRTRLSSVANSLASSNSNKHEIDQ
jgi:hypothetical protein